MLGTAPVQGAPNHSFKLDWQFLPPEQLACATYVAIRDAIASKCGSHISVHSEVFRRHNFWLHAPLCTNK